MTLRFPHSRAAGIPLVLATGLLLSCSGSSTTVPNGTEDTLTAPAPAVMPYQKPASGSADTFIVREKSALFYNPDSIQLKKIQEVLTKDLFETEEHNCFYLARNARIVLKKYWPKLKTFEITNDRYVLYIKNDKSQKIIDLDTLGDMCGLILFDGVKDPEPADMMNVDTALDFYFRK